MINIIMKLITLTHNNPDNRSITEKKELEVRYYIEGKHAPKKYKKNYVCLWYLIIKNIVGFCNYYNWYTSVT